MSKTQKGVFLAILGGLCWAGSGACGQYLFAKAYAVEWVSFYRLFFSGVFLSLFALGFFDKNFLRGKKALQTHKFACFKSPKEALSLLVFGLFGLMGCQYTYFKAISYLDAGTATMIQYTAPVFIMLLVCLGLKKLPKFAEFLALLAMILGLFLLATKGNLHEIKLNLSGLLWGLSSALGIVFYSLGARKIIARYSLSFVMGFGSLIGALVLGVFTQIYNTHYEFDLKLFLAMSFIIFIGTILAFCAYLKALEYIGAVKASIIACIEPLFAAFLAFVFLGTSYTALDLFAFALILSSVLLVSFEKRASNSKEKR